MAGNRDLDNFLKDGFLSMTFRGRWKWRQNVVNEDIQSSIEIGF